MIRAKGRFWLATRPDWVGDFSLAGGVVQTRAAGVWWSAVPRGNLPDDPELVAHLAASEDPVFGDRRQELVFIGSAQNMAEDTICRALDACLFGNPTAPVFEPDAWAMLGDPFPAWDRPDT